MKKSKFSEAQVAAALREYASEAPVGAVARKLGVSEQTIYIWKKKYASLDTADIRKVRQLEEENTKLKGLVADLSLDKVAPSVKSQLARDNFKIGERSYFRLSNMLVGSAGSSSRLAGMIAGTWRNGTYAYKFRQDGWGQPEEREADERQSTSPRPTMRVPCFARLRPRSRRSSRRSRR